MVRYSFLVRLSHPLLHAGLSRRLFDHFVRPIQKGLRNCDADLLRGFEIDHQLKLRGLLYGDVSGLGSLQDSVHEIGDAGDEESPSDRLSTASRIASERVDSVTASVAAARAWSHRRTEHRPRHLSTYRECD